MANADALVAVDGPGGTTLSWAAGTRVTTLGGGDRLELEVEAGATITIDFVEAYSCGLFASGVLPSYAHQLDLRQVDDRLERFFTVARAGRSVGVDLRSAETVSARISHQGIERGTRLEVDLGTGRDRHLVVVQAQATGYPPFAGYGVSIGDQSAADTHLTGLWGTVVGVLGSIDVPGSAYPTLPLPHRVYGTLHTFFDPDSWEAVNCLSYSGDPYLQAQARAVIERSRAALTPEGQIPHHFDVEEPCYVAISGAAQSGPNLFWPMAVLDHVSATGDHEYLAEIAPDLVRCLDWVLTGLDEDYGLLASVGPLWVDVFRKEGLTLDTNAMAVHVLGRLADALEIVGDVSTAQRYRAVADRIAAALDQLWRGDHYARALDVPGREPMPDLIDSDDSLAVLAGVADDARAELILARLAESMHPGGKGTWVSARRYDADRCYLGNTGDSDCTMARLWWAELRARRLRGHKAKFLELYRAVQADLLADIWMGERYDARGEQIRAFGYHEYPGVLNIMLREGVYGLLADVAGADVRPMVDGDFSYRVGEVGVARTGESLRVRLPGTGERRFTFHDLVPDGEYRWNGRPVRADAVGSLVVIGRAGRWQDLER